MLGWKQPSSCLQFNGCCVEGKPFPHVSASVPMPLDLLTLTLQLCFTLAINPISSQPFCHSGSIPTGCCAYLSFPAYRLQVKSSAQAKAKYLDPAVSTGLILSPQHFHSSASIAGTSFTYPAAQICEEN